MQSICSACGCSAQFADDGGLTEWICPNCGKQISLDVASAPEPEDEFGFVTSISAVGSVRSTAPLKKRKFLGFHLAYAEALMKNAVLWAEARSPFAGAATPGRPVPDSD